MDDDDADVAAPGQLIDRIIFGIGSGFAVGVADDDDDDALLELEVKFCEVLRDSLCVVLMLATDAAPDLEPLFLTFVRTMHRQILGLPRIRSWCV